VSEQEVQTPEDWAETFAKFLRDNPGPNIGHEKMKPSDDFWNQKEQERQIVKRLDSEIGNLQGAITLAERMIVLKASPGWESFVKAVEGCRAYRRVELELSVGTTADLRILQGRCRELGAILSLMNQTEKNTGVLASRLENLEAEKAEYVLKDGKVKPKALV